MEPGTPMAAPELPSLRFLKREEDAAQRGGSVGGVSPCKRFDVPAPSATSSPELPRTPAGAAGPRAAPAGLDGQPCAAHASSIPGQAGRLVILLFPMSTGANNKSQSPPCPGCRLRTGTGNAAPRPTLVKRGETW